MPLPAATSPDGGSARAQNRLNMQTFPEAPFRLNNWTAHGYQCVLDKTPDRILDIQARPLLTHYTLPCASDAQATLRNALSLHHKCGASISENKGKVRQEVDAYTAWRRAMWAIRERTRCRSGRAMAALRACSQSRSCTAPLSA